MAIGSIISRPDVRYPDADEFFSPSEAYPEYRHGHLARKPNPVYAMVREVFAQAGLDRANFGTAAWNPLGQYIRPGSKVFLLCNFVHHRRRTESMEDFLGKCTHGSVVRALADYVLIALEGESREQKAESGNQKSEPSNFNLQPSAPARQSSDFKSQVSGFSPQPSGTPRGRVLFGNAPLQSCDFERVLRETGAAAVRDFYAERKCPVEAKDLRLFVTERGVSGRTTRTIIRDQTEGVAVTLDGQSLLHEFDTPLAGTEDKGESRKQFQKAESGKLKAEIAETWDKAESRDFDREIREIREGGQKSEVRSQVSGLSSQPSPSEVRSQVSGLSSQPSPSELRSQVSALSRPALSAPAYRVADYDPDFIRDWHGGQKHRYFIHRSVLESDVIVCVPKLKTHEKVGITVGLKGYVGIVGRKECLPHHRFGAPKNGGDEYPASNPLLTVSSHLTDWVYRRGQDKPLQGLVQTADHTLRRVLRMAGCVTSGAWSGNDTTWRMALDLARIAHFADRDGKLHETIQRLNLAFVDGIIGGEGEGPLAPKAVASGCLVFSDDVALEDELACRLMGFPPEMLPIVREAVAVLKPRENGGQKNVSENCRGRRKEALAEGKTVDSDEIPSLLTSAPTMFYNGHQVELSDVKPALGRPFLPPRGWKLRLGAPCL